MTRYLLILWIALADGFAIVYRDRVLWKWRSPGR